jgi:hypothetical protein
VFLTVLLSGCAPASTPVPPIFTPSPIIPPTFTLEPTRTIAPPTATATPAVNYVTLGSPFAANCGNGIPILAVNGSFNGPFKRDGFNSKYGHSDWFVPEGCNIDTYSREVVSPIPGTLSFNGVGYDLTLPDGMYLEGIIEAVKFAGVENPSLDKITYQELSFGHFKNPEIRYDGGKSIDVDQGQPLGDCVITYKFGDIHPIVAYQVMVGYDGIEYMLSPTLFPNELADGTILRHQLYGSSENWTCAKDSYAKGMVESDAFHCIAEPLDYRPGTRP